MKPIFTDKWDELPVEVYETNREMGAAAANEAKKSSIKPFRKKAMPISSSRPATLS